MDLFKLLGTIAIDNKDANKALDETSGKGQQTESKLAKAFKGIGNGALAVGKAVGAGMIAAGTAVAGLVTQSTQSYAQYEQLVGGVETLFKDSASKVLEYANNAFQTAGMSANAYMETVTSFSASLLQSLGGDTEAAADKADMAIRDMSDNANKMGTDMTMIQNAYQGFAKQNYTMLDNLKLGYGGTKEEMERLLADATALSGVEYDISSYADVVDAIHVIQTEMGITGTTASEASGTISGSLSSVKASWQNLVTAMADDNADLAGYVDTFVGQAATMLENLMPRIGIALQGVVQLVNELAPVIIEKIPELLGQLLPAIIEAATGLIGSIVAILPQLIDMLINSVIPQLLDGFVSIFNAIIGALPTLAQTIVEALPTLLPQLITGLVSMIVMLCQVLPQIIQPLIDNLPTIVKAIVTALVDNAPLLFDAGIQLLIGLFNGMLSLIGQIPEILGIIFTGIVDGIKKLFGIHSPSTVMAGIGSNIMQGMIDGISGLVSKISGIWDNIKGFTKTAWNGIKSAITDPISKARDTVKGIVDKIKGFFSNMKLEFPKIKMPKFSIQPKGWEIGDLLKGKIPKLGIDWYAKAMDDPIIMNKPTIFGYDGSTGNLMGGGEVPGGEVVSGTNTLMNMIQGAVAAQNGELISYLDRLLEMLSNYFPEALEAMRTPATFDPDAAAVALAAPINRQLGYITARKDRGR